MTPDAETRAERKCVPFRAADGFVTVILMARVVFARSVTCVLQAKVTCLVA